MGFMDWIKKAGNSNEAGKPEIPAKEEGDSPFSMKIGDVFSIAGRGTVVTGKIDSGSVRLNDEVVIVGGDQSRGARVQSIEKSNKLLDKAKAGDEVGLLLGGIGKDSVKKGYLVADIHHIPIAGHTEEDISVSLSTDEQQQEDEKFQEIADGVISELTKCGFFKPEKIPFLAERVNSITRPGYGYSDPFSYENCLSVEEKKASGLNTRKKYAREYVDCLTPNGLKQQEPKELFENIWLQIYHKTHRKYELVRMKALGIEKVEILDCGDERDCSKIKRLKKIWPIDQVPELPLPGCDAAYCRCDYVSKDI